MQCTRWAHVNLPLDILRAFFHENVTIPFIRFRMFRHLYFRYPVSCKHYEDNEATPPIKGFWIREDPKQDPDIVVYYIHGGCVPESLSAGGNG